MQTVQKLKEMQKVLQPYLLSPNSYFTVLLQLQTHF